MNGVKSMLKTGKIEHRDTQCRPTTDILVAPALVAYAPEVSNV